MYSIHLVFVFVFFVFCFYGFLTGNAFTAGAKALKEGYGYSKDKLTAENPQPAQSAEMEALQQLSELGEHHPILLIDTFEHILPAHAKLVTRLMATRFGCVWV